MWRVIVLFVVVIVALGAILGLMIGLGTMRLALSDSRSENTPAAPATRSTPIAETPATAPSNSLLSPPVQQSLVQKSNVLAEKRFETPPVAVKPIPMVAPRPAPEDSGAVTQLVIVKAEGIQPIVVLTDGMTLDLAGLGAKTISVKADVMGKVRSVRFEIDGGKTKHVENMPPYTIAGDGNGRCTPWKPPPGEHTLAVTPYSGPNASGVLGKTLLIRFEVVKGGDALVLSAASAKLNGQKLRLQNLPEQNVGFWSQPDESIEWTLHPKKPGMYRVEITYACDPQNGGGVFEMLVGHHRFTGTSKPTGSWDQYSTLHVGTLALAADPMPVVIKPVSLDDGRALMNVRSVKLVPTKE